MKEKEFMKSIKTALFYSATFLLASCETMPAAPPKMRMSTVMNECEATYKVDFDQYANCIKLRYAAEGTTPDAVSVRAFISNLDALNEMYTNKQITNAQAKAQAYDYYLKTIHAQNERNTAILLNQFNNLQQQQLLQQSIQQQQIRTPVQTTCFKNGQYVNCTSY